MKKKYNLINEILQKTKNIGITQLSAQDEYFDGRVLTINNKPVLNFGSYSYLGLETHPSLKEAAIDSIQKYGIQYPFSRAYISNPLYATLEELVEKMFGAPIVLTASLCTGHHGVMPILVEEGDAIIMDQQVHSTVQDAARKLQLNGVHLTIVRHNRMDELETKLKELIPHYNKIWYMCDGVYSMYGDVAPLEELISLVNKYKPFHLYVDDAHGMSSFGKDGTGFVLNQIPLHPKMILCTGMAKAFGTVGGIFVIPDAATAQKVRTCAGPLIFSGQQATPVLSASIASAKIHLSDEIYDRQKRLAERIAYCHKLLKEFNLPDISDPKTPIFFIGLGMMSVGTNMVKKMLDDGYFVNLAVFPAVPETCTGIRFTITLHLSMEDIKNMVQTLAKNFPKVLEEEGRTVKDIQKAFRKFANLDFLDKGDISSVQSNYKTQHERTINNIEPKEWDRLLGERGVFNVDGLKLLEKAFQGNSAPQDNWDFHYWIIRDSSGKPLIATFFTVVIGKDDMLAPASVSLQIEELRKKDPYHLTSKTMLMGAMVSEGNHLHIDYSYPEWKEVLMLLLDQVQEEHEKAGTEVLSLRDFNANDENLNEFLLSHGFMKVNFPDVHVLNMKDWTSKEDFISQFNKHRRQYLKQKVFTYEDDFQTTIHTQDSPDLNYWYKLYTNVSQKSCELNTFMLPKSFFKAIMNDPNWEIIELRIKPEVDNRENKAPVAVMFCFKNPHRYIPLYVGLDYEFIEYNIYPQILWQTILRAKDLKLSKVNFGFTASQNKRKFGAEAVPRQGYVQLKDNFKMAMIGLIPNEAKVQSL
ncbi:MAG: aminotransferase class I/II-fold pyridoxal phosphate-dependent enzyme [Cytophagaceae bacterium]